MGFKEGTTLKRRVRKEEAIPGLRWEVKFGLVLQETTSGVKYFCQSENTEYFKYASTFKR